MPPITRLLLPLAALGALALTPAAQAATIPVPAGQVQHTVWDSNVSGTKATKDHPHRKHELWLGADRGRSVFTDADTGQVIDECVTDPGATRCWNTESKRIDVYPPSLGVLGLSWAQEEANVKEAIDRGFWAFSGDTTYMGKPAQLYKATRASDADDNQVDTLTAEPGTLFPLQYEGTDPQGAAVLHSIQSVTLRETLAPSVVSFAMGSHPGAKVVDHRPHVRKHTTKKHKKHHKAKPKKKASHY